jgi:hypothetical protein
MALSILYVSCVRHGRSNSNGNAIAIMISPKAKAIVNIMTRSPDPIANFMSNRGEVRQDGIRRQKLRCCGFCIDEHDLQVLNRALISGLIRERRRCGLRQGGDARPLATA